LWRFRVPHQPPHCFRRSITKIVASAVAED
jgi:hypothetical protein